MPKLKLFLFLSVFQIFINIACFLNNSINSNSFNVLAMLGGVGISFVPFVSLIQLVFSNFTPEALAFIGIFTGIISSVQTYLIVEIVISHTPTINV